jgi:hypothetical protein
MNALNTMFPLPATRRGVDPLDADATGAMARLASDLQAVERAIGHRFPAAAVVANFNRALQTDAAGPSGAWTEFYLALARFMNVAIAIVERPAAADTLAAFRRLGDILADDFGQRLLTVSEQGRLKRRLRKLAEPGLAARA